MIISKWYPIHIHGCSVMDSINLRDVVHLQLYGDYLPMVYCERTAGRVKKNVQTFSTK